jgi:site-specific recombinase XerC
MGSDPGRKERKATGIYQDRHGITIRVRGKDTKPRWPLGTPTTTLIKARKALLDDAGPLVARRGTLAEDVPRYLATLPADVKTGIERRRRRSDAKRLLDRWLEAATILDGRSVTFAQVPRDAITSVMVKTQLAAWHSDGMAESTCDHHRRELGTLYNILNGKEGYNPVRAVSKFNKQYDDPRGFDLAVMDLIIASMPDRGKPIRGEKRSTINQAKIRLRVMRACAIPPQTLKRVVSTDVDLRTKTLTIRPRRKGKGTEGRALPLTTIAVDALRVFVKQKLFGWFDSSSMNRSFTRAAKRYRDQWAEDHPDEPCPVPDDLHAYDLRHGFLSDAFRRTKNLKVVGHLAGHAPGSTLTDRYVQAAVDDVARAAVDALDLASTTDPQSGKEYAIFPTK